MTVGIITIGSGSINIVEACKLKGLHIESLFHIGTKMQLEKIKPIQQLPEARICHADDEDLEQQLTNWFVGCDTIILVAGLGGKTVLQHLPNVLKMALKEQKEPVLIYSLPAVFEGIKRAITAQKTFSEIPQDVKLVHIDNVSEKDDMVSYFKQMDNKFYEQIMNYIKQLHVTQC